MRWINLGKSVAECHRPVNITEQCEVGFLLFYAVIQSKPPILRLTNDQKSQNAAPSASSGSSVIVRDPNQPEGQAAHRLKPIKAVGLKNHYGYQKSRSALKTTIMHRF